MRIDEENAMSPAEATAVPLEQSAVGDLGLRRIERLGVGGAMAASGASPLRILKSRTINVCDFPRIGTRKSTFAII